MLADYPTATGKFKVDLSGQIFGQLTVIRRVRDPRYNIAWECLCNCGIRTVIPAQRLRLKQNVSCGCFKRSQTAQIKYSHGLAGTPEYQVWKNIVHRCTQPNNPGWHNYGGRGICICDEWRYNPAAFIAHVGKRPSPKHQIDRINNDGNYEPGNVRWVTRSENLQNKRGAATATFHGITKGVAAWAQEFGVSYNILHKRLKAGWSMEQAISTPVFGIKKP